MRTRWSFDSLPGRQYELVLREDEAMSSEKSGFEIIKRTGYVSSNLGDILKASWYLNGGFKSDLDERKIQILNMFR